MATATAKFRYVDQDRGMRAIMREVARAEGYVKVGVLQAGAGRTAEEAEGKPATNTEIAFAHEFGARNIPERSFLRSTFDRNRESYFGLLRRMVPLIYDRKLTGRQMLELMGQRVTADVKGAITSGAGIPPPLAPSTVAAKGSSRPLVDTGQLLNSITYAFVDTSLAAKVAAEKAAATKKAEQAARKAANRKKRFLRKVSKAGRSFTRAGKSASRIGRRTAKGVSRSTKRGFKAAFRGLKRSEKQAVRGVKRVRKSITKGLRRAFGRRSR